MNILLVSGGPRPHMLQVRNPRSDRKGQFRTSDKGFGPSHEPARGHQNHKEQEEVPSSGSDRSTYPGPSQDEGQGRSTQRDTHAGLFLLQEPPLYQLRTHEVIFSI